MTEPSLQEESLFAKALEIGSAEERAAFLDLHCGDNQELRAEVEALLLASQRSGDLLDLPEEQSASPTLALPLPILPGTIIGPYKLLQQIGEGGMGVVYMAEQSQPVQRKVALKIIKPGMDSRQVIARFEAERQALAMMDHVNIARVIDGGTISSPLSPPGRGARGEGASMGEPGGVSPGCGRPYFVMELINGIPITKYCDDNHLTPRERLELFIPVCQAVQHAHQKGIIHRDIKPSNVLVTLYDGKPVPKVIDFGVAKAIDQKLTDNTLFTNFGTMVGTLEYMSPEQADLSALGVDTRSDIYSLGVLLYELLTGSTPLTRKRLKEAANLEILRLIKEEEPPKPSTRISESGDALASISAQRKMEPAKLTKFVRGELDWIVMKTLEKDRNRRYETANGLAVELQRYLADEPVHACPPSKWYLMKKFARRNRVPVMAVSLVILALVGGIVGASWGLIKAEEQRIKAEKAEAETLDAFRASTDDAILHLIGSKQGLSQQERAYIEKTIERWKSFADRTENNKRGRAIRAEGLFRVARLWSNLGRMDEARAYNELAREMRKQLVAEFPDEVEFAMALAKSHNNLAVVLANLGKYDDARTEYLSAREIWNNLAEQFPTVPEYSNQLARTLSNLADPLGKLNKNQEAIIACRAARDIRKKLVEQFPTNPEYQFGLALTHTNLAVYLIQVKNREEAREELRLALNVYEWLVKHFPDAPDNRRYLAHTHHNLGSLLSEIGENEASLAEHEAARDLRLKLVEQFPAIPAYIGDLARSHERIGSLYWQFRKRDEACAEWQSARNLLKKLLGQSPAVTQYAIDLAKTHQNLGKVHKALGEVEESVTEYNAAITMYQKLCKQLPAALEYQAELASTHNQLGLLLCALGKVKEAHSEYDSALRLQLKLCEQFPAVSQYSIGLGGIYCNLGMLFRKEGKCAESLKWLDMAIHTLNTAREKVPPKEFGNNYLGISHFNRAQTYDLMQKYSEAMKDWNRAIELSPQSELLRYRTCRAKTLLRSGQPAKAIDEVSELAKNPNVTFEDLFSFACFYAVASGELVKHKQEYADRAMELLSKAVKLGYKDVASTYTDIDLNPLRDRDDFKKLVTNMEKKASPQTKK